MVKRAACFDGIAFRGGKREGGLRERWEQGLLYKGTASGIHHVLLFVVFSEFLLLFTFDGLCDDLTSFFFSRKKSSEFLWVQRCWI